MDLKIKDLVELFQLSEKTIYRWIKEKKIPAYRINHQYRFSKSEINEWILNNRIKVSSKILDLQTSLQPVNLISMLNKGGFFYDIEGKSVKDVIINAVGEITLPENLTKENVIARLLEREKMMPTSIGFGLAIPHPRNPIISDTQSASISIWFLKNNVDFKAIDNVPVHTMFVIITANPKKHLEILAKISYLCQQPKFRNLLKARAKREEILKYIIEKEKEWDKRQDRDE